LKNPATAARRLARGDRAHPGRGKAEFAAVPPQPRRRSRGEAGSRTPVSTRAEAAQFPLR